MEIFREGVITFFDAAMGTALQAAGQPAGTGSEEMNLIAPDTVKRIHRKNIEAGVDVITSNSFGVTQMMLRGERERALQALEAAVGLAREAAEEYVRAGESVRPIHVCLDIGPTGALLGEYGSHSYEEAAEFFVLQAEAGARRGADFILLETFGDQEEIFTAARAAMKAADIPVFGLMTFGESGRSYMGASPASFAKAAREEGLAAAGANCSLDPKEMFPIIEELVKEAKSGGVHLPVVAMPNAGQPYYINGKANYDMTEAAFAAGSRGLIELGVSAIGGCCGTTPAMIKAIRDMMSPEEENK